MSATKLPISKIEMSWTELQLQELLWDERVRQTTGLKFSEPTR